MFQFLQSHLKKIFVVLLFFIIPSFSFYFIGNTTGGSTDVVGIMFGKKVKEADFQNAYRAVSFDAAMKYGSYFKQFAPFLGLEQQTWNRLILLKKSKDKKIKVSVDELKNELISIYKSISGNKEFDAVEYEKIISQNLRMSIAVFEGMIKENLRIKKLRDEIVKDVKVNDEEVDKFYKEENNKLQFSFIKIESKNYEKDVVIDDAKLKEFFDKDKKRFTIPDKIKLNYVYLSKDDFKSKVTVTDEDCKAYYEDNKDEFKIVEESKEQKAPAVDAESKEPSDDEALVEKFKEFDTVKEQIKTNLLEEKVNMEGEGFFDSIYREMIEKNDFTSVVNAHTLAIKTTPAFDKNSPSEDIGNPSSPQIKDAFELAVNDFCGPYEYKNGWLILQVTEKMDSKIPDTIDEVRSVVEGAYRTENAPPLAENKANEFKQKILALLDKKAFEEAVSELGLKSEVSGILNVKEVTVQGLGNEPGIVKKAFELKDDEVSNVLQTSQGNLFVVIQVSKREAPDMSIFSGKKEEYTKKTLEDKQRNFYTQWLENAREEADIKTAVVTPPQEK